ncbi:hypothetical protein [Asaia bogorensis]|uniref:hypothetical protein n=1 Tax=Asaia bogorensis TaxID=91915 RepID=UPI0013CE8870|nr:hypothetical protein [Asaia bogorensis]
MSPMNVSTAKDRVVKDLSGKPVPAQFSVDPTDPFWARLIAAGDIVEIKADPTPSESSATPAAGSTASSTTAPSNSASTTPSPAASAASAASSPAKKDSGS